MRRRKFNPPHPVGKINVTPLIDVVMCLIIFYLIVGKLASQRQTHLDLPSTHAGAKESSEHPLIINVLPLRPGQTKPRLLIGSVPVAESDLDSVLKAQLAAAPRLSVELRADRTLDYGMIAPVIEACRRTGLASVKLAAEKGS